MTLSFRLSAAILVPLLAGGCVVGPNFKPHPPPSVAGYTQEQ
jgi:hypothetical protein